jgi:ATP-dependent RNA helicase DDX10/DBP4
MAIYFTFAEKKFATLITTNVASRGLDFPKVDWVVQVDCPEDVPTYIHRMGRTARYKAGGNSLLMLQEHELPFLEKLK